MIRAVCDRGLLFSHPEQFDKYAAYIKNTTGEGGVRNQNRDNTKNNTQQSATSPLSGRLSNKKGSLDYDRVATAAAELGIEDSLPDLSDKVKRSIVVLADIAQAAENRAIVYNSKKPVTADNLIGLLVSQNVFMRSGNNNSVYMHDGENAVRLSNHSADTSNFRYYHNLNVVLRKPGSINDFRANTTKNAVEAVFRVWYLNKDPKRIKALIQDIARFIATGVYEDTAGAQQINVSGDVSDFYNELSPKNGREQSRDDDYMSVVERGDMETAQKDIRFSMRENVEETRDLVAVHNMTHDSNIRIAPTFPSPEDLDKAMDIFCVCTGLAAAEKLPEA